MNIPIISYLNLILQGTNSVKLQLQEKKDLILPKPTKY